MGKYNDIEKMRAEFEEKIRLAELENKLNEGVEGYEIHVNDKIVKDAPYSYWINVRIPYKPRVGFVEPSISDVADVLKRFQNTRDTVYDNRWSLPFVVHARRSYGDRYGILSLSWISGEYQVNCSLQIDGSDLYDEFFRNISFRPTTSSEDSTYVSIHQSRAEKICPVVPEYNFKAEQKCYYGGVKLLIDLDEIERLIEFIKKH